MRRFFPRRKKVDRRGPILRAVKIAQIIETCTTMEQLNCMRPFCLYFENWFPSKKAYRDQFLMDIADELGHLYLTKAKEIKMSQLLAKLQGIYPKEDNGQREFI
jgi:hypothetical protein